MAGKRVARVDEADFNVETVNKTACCARFGWSRHVFDVNVAAGMPTVRAASHKGDEWLVDVGAVAAWIEERAAARREYALRQQERSRRMFAEMDAREERRRLTGRAY